MMRRIACIAAVLLMIPATIALAENRAETFSVTPFLGGYSFDGKQHLETRPVIGIRGGYNFTDAVGAEALIDYTPSEGTVNGKNTTVFNYSLGLLYHLFPNNRLVPFLMAGYGGISIDQEDNGRTSKGAFNYGAGVKYSLSKSMELRGELRHILFKTSETLSNIEYGIGVGFLFGGTAPVPAAVAEPVEQPAPKAAPVVVPPAPAPPPPAPVLPPKANLLVSQGTLMKGESTALSWSSENATNCDIQPGIGAVPPQGTKSIAPSDTTAYTLACTGPGGTATSSAHVTVNVPPPPEPAPEKLTMELNVQFDTGKADIKKKYHEEIGRVAEFLKKYPTVHGVIEGHTDNVGSAEMNMKLSQRRADSIRKYLLDVYGIDPARLAAKGYGLTRPIADNKTAEGRQKNRRIQAQFETVVKK